VRFLDTLNFILLLFLSCRHQFPSVHPFFNNNNNDTNQQTTGEVPCDHCPDKPAVLPAGAAPTKAPDGWRPKDWQPSHDKRPRIDNRPCAAHDPFGSSAASSSTSAGASGSDDGSGSSNKSGSSGSDSGSSGSDSSGWGQDKLVDSIFDASGVGGWLRMRCGKRGLVLQGWG
jgi:hypothetical protein